MIDVLLLYEHKVRELETIIALKLLLEKKKFTVEICCVYELDTLKFLFSRKPRLVVVPYLYSNNEIRDIVIRICGNVRKIVNLQWEQVYNGVSKTCKRTPKETAALATHICWGEESKQRLLLSGIKNAVITGAPQLDFLKEKFNGYYLPSTEIRRLYQIDSEKKILLFISTFSYYSIKSDVIEQLRSLVDFDPDVFQKITIKSRDILFDWFIRFLNENQKYVLIYRPHPSEQRDEKLIDFAKHSERIFVISDYSVKQWITISDVVLNWYSTSGVEAFFAKVNCLYLRPVELPKENDYKMYENVCKIRKYEDMCDYIINKHKIDDYYMTHDIGKDISNYYLNDGSYAIENIASLISEMLMTEYYDLQVSIASKTKLPFIILKNRFKKICISIFLQNPSIALATIGKIPNIKKSLIDYENKRKNIASEIEIKNIEKKMKFFIDKWF